MRDRFRNRTASRRLWLKAFIVAVVVAALVLVWAGATSAHPGGPDCEIVEEPDYEIILGPSGTRCVTLFMNWDHWSTIAATPTEDLPPELANVDGAQEHASAAAERATQAAIAWATKS